MAIRGNVGRALVSAALLAGVGFVVTAAQKTPATKPAATARKAATPFAATRKALEEEMSKKRTAFDRERLRRGMDQVARFWRPSDGDAKVFEAFVRANFADEQPAQDALFARLEKAFETLDGYMVEINRDFRMQTDLDKGEVYPIDETLAGYDASAHVSDDFFGNKVAFIVLLNYPLTTLEQRLTQGEKWSRRQWAEARLAQRFSKRIPAEVNLEIAEVSARADQYIAEYNVWMHHLVDDKGVRLFPPKMRLLSHWNLRDEIKADYGDATNGLAKQRTIQTVMERIVTQTIPQAVLDNPHVDWNPTTNTVAGFHCRRLRRLGKAGAREAHERARAGHPLQDAPRHVPRGPEGRSVLADRADAHRPPFRREPRAPRGAGPEDVRGRPDVSPRPARREADREATRPAARALRRLVQRVQAAREVHRGASSTRW